MSILPEELWDAPIVADKSIDKLNSLGYDPIARLVRLSRVIDKEMHDMMYDAKGMPKRKFSQVAYTALVSTQQKIANDLLRYGYMRVPEVQEVKTSTVEPIRIVLT